MFVKVHTNSSIFLKINQNVLNRLKSAQSKIAKKKTKTNFLYPIDQLLVCVRVFFNQIQIQKFAMVKIGFILSAGKSSFFYSFYD